MVGEGLKREGADKHVESDRSLSVSRIRQHLQRRSTKRDEGAAGRSQRKKPRSSAKQRKPSASTTPRKQPTPSPRPPKPSPLSILRTRSTPSSTAPPGPNRQTVRVVADAAPDPEAPPTHHGTPSSPFQQPRLTCQQSAALIFGASSEWTAQDNVPVDAAPPLVCALPDLKALTLDDRDGRLGVDVGSQEEVRYAGYGEGSAVRIKIRGKGVGNRQMGLQDGDVASDQEYTLPTGFGAVLGSRVRSMQPVGGEGLRGVNAPVTPPYTP